MTSLGGIFLFCGSPASTAEASTGSLSHSTARRWICADGVVSMQNAALSDKDQSGTAEQLYVTPSGLVVSWSGHLHNREHLGATLRIAPTQHNEEHRIVAAAYERWGVDAFSRFIGEWAAAVWDADRNCILLARDYSGSRPLYYKIVSARAEWSSDLASLAAGIEPDNEYLRAWILTNPDPIYTAYKEIRSVPPGGVVRISRGGHSIFSSWRPDLGASIRYSRSEEYDEEFYSLFRTAVRDRMQTDQEIWAELSGGLDSSSVVCMAADILSREPVSASALQTVSYVLDRGDLDDEQQYMDEVIRNTGAPTVRLHEHEYSAFFPTLGEPCSPVPIANPGRHSAVARLMAESGARVLLTGLGGDAVMWSSPRICPHVADLLGSFSLRRLNRELLACSVSSGRGYWDILWHDAVEGLFPSLRSQIRRRPVPWLIPNPGAAAVDEYMSGHLADGADGVTSNTTRVYWQNIRDSIRIASFNAIRVCLGTTPSYPFLDRRLVQFMLATPFDLKRNGPQTRVLHRRALAGLLPEAIATRTSKVSGSGFVCRAIAREWSSLLSLFTGECRTARLGLVQPGRIREALDRARAGTEPMILELLRTIAVEVWLRSVETAQRGGGVTCLHDAAASVAGQRGESPRQRSCRK